MGLLKRSMVVAISLLSFCAFANAADSPPPFTLTISGPGSVVVGDEIKIAAVLKNLSKQTVRISEGVQHKILVHAAGGEQLHPKPGDRVFAGSFGFLSLAPGETSPSQYIIVSGDHGGEYDVNKPGKYVVRVQRSLEDAGYPKGTVVESNKITIKVVPKKADAPK